MSTLKYFVLLMAAATLVACAKEEEETGNFLYAVSGNCTVGGLTAQSPARTITRFRLDNGSIDRTIVDYNSSVGDTPAAAMNLNSDEMIVLVENTGGRRLEKVKKATGERSLLTTYATGTWNSVVKDLVSLADGGYLIARTAAVERYSSSHGRVPITGTTAWINAPGGACATSTTGVVRAGVLANGKLLFMNSAANQNRFGIISATGYASAADCLAAQASPNISTQFPSSLLYLPDEGGEGVGHLLVSYTSSTAGQNMIGSYTIDENSNTIGSMVTAFTNTAVLYGASAMTQDPETKKIYVANGATVFSNTIESFSYEASTQILTRNENIPFATETINSRCISSMFIAD